MARREKLPQFADERDFEDRYLIPKLKRLGFSVAPNHGTDEYGKDLILTFYDQFGHPCYHGVQTKFESIGLGRKVQSIIDDAIQAFDMPFVHPNTGQRECRISQFFVMNGSTISTQARNHFFAKLGKDRGGSVKLFSFKELEALASSDSLVRALITEIDTNRTEIEVYISSVPTDGAEPLLSQNEVKKYLETPTLVDLGGLAEEYRECIIAVNRAAKYVTDLTFAKILFNDVIRTGNALKSKAEQQLASARANAESQRFDSCLPEHPS